MPESVDYDEELGVVVVRSYGRVTSEEVASSVAQVGKLAAEKGCDRVLVDAEDLEILPAVGEMFFLASTFPRTGRLAAVQSSHESAREGLRFAENAARNRGVNFRLFRSRREALDWLDG